MLYSETFIDVRYYETDQMGIVHHSNYIRYFECARDHMLVESGYPIQECEKDGVMIPIVSVECHYKFPAKMGDHLRCVAMIDRVPMAKLPVRQQVFNQDGVLCAEGVVTLGFINKITRRPVRCPEKLAGIFAGRMNDR
ncbi:MAG: thioesterase family protein [Bacteroidales bacterium]